MVIFVCFLIFLALLALLNYLRRYPQVKKYQLPISIALFLLMYLLMLVLFFTQRRGSFSWPMDFFIALGLALEYALMYFSLCYKWYPFLVKHILCLRLLRIAALLLFGGLLRFLIAGSPIR